MNKKKLGIIRPDTYRFALGDFEIATFLDSTISRDGPYPIFGNNIDEKLLHKLAIENNLPAKRFEHGFTPTLVNTGKYLILFDTGNGNLNNENKGQLMYLLEKAGYDHADIDYIVITHCHPDHIGGLELINDNYFPNAEIVTGRVEYDFWKNGDLIPEQRIPNKKLFDRICLPLSDRMRFIESGQDVVSGITALEAFGHSNGHMAYYVESENKQLLITADVTNHYVVSLQVPEWHVAFDDNKEQAVITRKKILEMVFNDKIPIIGYHMPFPSIGYIGKEKGQYKWIPVSYQLTV
jgi:glyoxylase-like metal-dependent hydrolase (beta-lactamase superfamily II)